MPTSMCRRLLIAVLLLMVLPACGGGADTFEIVVPAGTQERILAGEVIDVMPNRIELRVGDTLLIRNEDSVTQSVGPYMVAAGREMTLTYGSVGRYEGYCPLSADETYEIIVTN